MTVPLEVSATAEMVLLAGVARGAWEAKEAAGAAAGAGSAGAESAAAAVAQKVGVTRAAMAEA